MKINKISAYLTSLALIGGAVACQSPEAIQPSETIGFGTGVGVITNIKASIFEDTRADNNFTGEVDYENNEIRIVVPYNYPVSSDTVMTLERLTKVRVIADIENNVIITPPLHFLDLSHDNYVNIRDQHGENRQFRIYADIRKSSECDITDFEFVKKTQISNKKWRLDTLKAFPSAAESVVRVPYAEDTLGSGAANVKLSYHATISPNPSDTLNYDEGVEFTVTAQNGVDKKVWRVQRGIPPTLKRGLRPESAKLLWTVKLSQIGYNGNDEETAQNGLAPSGEYVLVNQIGMADPVYINRKTGAVAGKADFSAIAPLDNNRGNYCVTADEAGHILICNTDKNGQRFQIWRMDNVNDTPKEFINTNVAYNWRGHHISVTGDIDKNAVITAPLNGTNAWFTRWIVKNGELESQDGEMIQPVGFDIPWANCDVVYKSPNAESDYFVNAYCDVTGPGAVAENRYVAWVKNNNIAALTPTYERVIGTSSGRSSANWVNSHVDYKVFNGVGYVLDQRVNTFTWGSGGYDTILLFDTQSGDLSKEAINFTSYETVEWNRVIGLKVDDIYGAKDQGNPPGLEGAANGIQLQVSEDGFYMYIYFMFAKGCVGCVRVDCFDI